MNCFKIWIGMVLYQQFNIFLKTVQHFKSNSASGNKGLFFKLSFITNNKNNPPKPMGCLKYKLIINMLHNRLV